MSVSSISFICLRTCGGRGILAASLQAPQVTTWRNSSDDVRFLTHTDLSALKKGRGGRSSFSGVVATIFGATGFLGRYVVNKLGKNGTQMIIPYRCEPYDCRHLKVAGDLGQVLFHHCDEFTDDQIKRAIKYSDVVINLIGRDHETPNNKFEKVNIEIAEKIARVCKEMGTERFIHVSSLNADREHEGYKRTGGSRWLRTKGEGERRVREQFPDAIIFRPSDVWGSEDRFLRYFAKSNRHFHSKHLFLPLNGKDIWKQPVYVSDLAQGIVNAMTLPSVIGNTYEAVGPRRYELHDLVDWIFRVCRKDNVRWNFKMWDMKWAPLLPLAAAINEKFILPYIFHTTPIINVLTPMEDLSLDKIEREVVTDITTDLPNLTDLGVNLTLLEHHIKHQLDHYRAFQYYYEEIGEFPDVKPPKFVEAI